MCMTKLWRRMKKVKNLRKLWLQFVPEWERKKDRWPHWWVPSRRRRMKRKCTLKKHQPKLLSCSFVCRTKREIEHRKLGRLQLSQSVWPPVYLTIIKETRKGDTETPGSINQSWLNPTSIDYETGLHSHICNQKMVLLTQPLHISTYKENSRANR